MTPTERNVKHRMRSASALLEKLGHGPAALMAIGKHAMGFGPRQPNVIAATRPRAAVAAPPTPRQELRTTRTPNATVPVTGDLAAAIRAAAKPKGIDRSAALRAARPSILARLRAALATSSPLTEPIRAAASISSETIPAPDLNAAIRAAQQKGRK